MPAITIASFSTFAGLLLAARQLAAEPGRPDRARALAGLAASAGALDAALRAAGLTALAREMAGQAEETARYFTHPGRARDDAITVFWQVAPFALADPDAFAAADLDVARTTDRMVAAIKASGHARDFAATVLAEPFFRAVACQMLSVMLASERDDALRKG